MKKILVISLLFTFVACSPSQATLQALPSQTPPAISTARPTSDVNAMYTSAAATVAAQLTKTPAAEITNIPSETPFPATPTLDNSQTVIVSVIIVSQSIPGSTTLDLWLEFQFNPGDILPGSQIDAELSNGTLELTLPGGEKKTYEGIPADTGGMPFSSQSFENYTDKPSGPAIRIPFETLPDSSATGEYQIAWHSGNFQSNILVFEWDGKEITVH